MAAIVNAGPPDLEKLKTVMLKHGLVPVMPPNSEGSNGMQPNRFAGMTSPPHGTPLGKDHAAKPQNSRAISKRLWSTPLPDGSIPFVRMQQLWEMAEGLPSRKVRVAELNALDEVRWFS